MTQYVLAVVLGLLFAFGTFLVLRRDVVRVVWGVIIMGQAANVYLVTMGGISPEAVAPIVHGSGEATTDPLVQALVLTAIVIGFGTTAFALVLTYRVYEEHGTLDLDDVSTSELRGSLVADGGTAARGRDGATDEALDESGPDGSTDGGVTDG
ncbi:cation:proton antiporter [Halobacteriales archaeon QS_1_68_20]|nr:MAG: cation:proton antiporter [Halobacteriales archaeon QS_1_68_20]